MGATGIGPPTGWHRPGRGIGDSPTLPAEVYRNDTFSVPKRYGRQPNSLSCHEASRGTEETEGSGTSILPNYGVLLLWLSVWLEIGFGWMGFL